MVSLKKYLLMKAIKTELKKFRKEKRAKWMESTIKDSPRTSKGKLKAYPTIGENGIVDKKSYYLNGSGGNHFKLGRRETKYLHFEFKVGDESGKFFNVRRNFMVGKVRISENADQAMYKVRKEASGAYESHSTKFNALRNMLINYEWDREDKEMINKIIEKCDHDIASLDLSIIKKVIEIAKGEHMNRTKDFRFL